MKVRNAKPAEAPYKLPDEKGLHLLVTPAGHRSWRWRYQKDGKDRLEVLGAYPEMSLREAREARDDRRQAVRKGAAAPEKALPSPTFAEVARDWHRINAPRWKPHHAADVLSGLETHILAPLGTRPIGEVGAPELLAALRAVEKRSPDVAHRIRGRVEAVFAFAIGAGVSDPDHDLQSSGEMNDIRTMTKQDREALAKLIRQRERLAKTAATERSKVLLADFEQQADREYSWDEDNVWRSAVLSAKEEVAKAQTRIAERCRELGIPQPFAPTISVGWHQQRASVGGERAKMRQVAKRRIEQIEATARTAIERASVAAQESLLTGSLTSDAAKLFAESLPSIEELMPQFTVAELQRQLIEERPLHRGFGAIGYDDA